MPMLLRQVLGSNSMSSSCKESVQIHMCVRESRPKRKNTEGCCPTYLFHNLQ
uniref:Uncharacterized protein n=1 Tax=Triticum urartu TaxID=4572 RepID=A0A8R7QCV9_TRIUA